MQTHVQLGEQEDATASIVRAKERTLAALHAPDGTLGRHARVLDLWCAGWFWPDGEAPNRTAFGELVDVLLGRGGSLPSRITKGLLDAAHVLAAQQRFVHWPLTFPEVFHDADGQPLGNAGFDAIVGNPPWDMVRGDSGETGTRQTRRDEAKSLTAFVRESGIYRVDAHSHVNRYQLFVERARSVEPHFTLTDANASVVAEICRRLDGLPLAIELAAASIRLLSPQGMLSLLEQRLMVLIGGARDLPARQQTLRATIAWSYDLLGPAEQELFQRLSIFVGGFTMAAARSVAGGQRPSTATPQEGEHAPGPPAVPALDGDVLQLLESLLAMSLVQREVRPDGEQRFSILETVREFGLERLGECGEVGALRRRHASAYLTFAERAKQELSGPDQGVWLARLEAELPVVSARLGEARAGGNAPAENLDLRDAMDALA